MVLDVILNGAGDEVVADARHVLALCGGDPLKVVKVLASRVEDVEFCTEGTRREALHEVAGCALALLALDEHRRGEEVVEREDESMAQRRAIRF